MFFSLLVAVVPFAVMIDADMTVEEMKQTGMAKLSAQEKVALQNWLEGRYGKKMVAQNEKKPAPILQENLKNGHYIRLSDLSLWEINSPDTPITQGWITPVEIKVSASQDPAYPYILTNTLTGSSVKARKATSIDPSPKTEIPKRG